MDIHNIVCMVKDMWSTQRLLCADKGFLCQLVSWVLFQLRKLLLRQECVTYIYTVL